MKILIVTQYFWPENFRINDFALGLYKKGHEISVLTGIPNYPGGSYFKGYGLFKKRKDIYNGIKIYRTFIVSRGNSKGIKLILNYLSYAFFGSLSSLFFITKKFDIIFVYQLSPVTIAIPAIILKKITKIPICMWILDLWPESVFAASDVNNKFIYRFLTILVKFIYRNCDKILVQSKGFIPSIIEKKININKISYYPNWAEDIFQNSNINNLDVRNLPKGFIILFAGNIGEAQDFPAILNTAEILLKHKDIHWVILGDGRKKSWVENEIKERKLMKNFHMLGNYPLDRMPSFFSKADVLLVSLKKDPIFSLTIPGKVQSYMASGKPIMAMLDGEGTRIITEGGAGLACDSGDVDGLVRNIILFYKMKKNELKKIGENGKKYYKKHFNRDNQINKAEQILYSMIKDK